MSKWRQLIKFYFRKISEILQIQLKRIAIPTNSKIMRKSNNREFQSFQILFRHELLISISAYDIEFRDSKTKSRTFAMALANKSPL